MLPEREIPSHHGPDAKSVDPELNIITSAVKVPETLNHLHYWNVKLKTKTTKEEVLKTFRTCSRIKLIHYDQGLVSDVIGVEYIPLTYYQRNAVKLFTRSTQTSEFFDFKINKTWGDVNEDRGGQITFSVLDQHATLVKNKQWDPQFEKRN